jgi:ketosteroid isomerase-like protein
MAEENVEIISAVMAAFNRGDWDAALSYAAPNVKYDTSRDLNETRGIYETPEGVRRAWEQFHEPWESWRIEIDEFVDVGEDTVVTRQTGYLRGRDGIEVTARQIGVWIFRDGAVSEFTSYNQLGEALEAAGLDEGRDGRAPKRGRSERTART